LVGGQKIFEEICGESSENGEEWRNDGVYGVKKFF